MARIERFQTPTTTPYIERSLHVWIPYPLRKGYYKCVICGGISCHPNNYCECERYEKLTDKERDMCPQ